MKQGDTVMLRKSLSIGLLSLVGAIGIAAPAQAQVVNSEDWLNKAFVQPLPSKLVDGKAVTDSRRDVLEQLKKLSSGTYLRTTDVKNFSKGLQFLAGNYYYIDKNNVVQLVGKTSSAGEGQEIEITDGIVLRAIVNDKLQSGITLPLFGLNLKHNELAELTVRDVATAHGDSNIDRAACRYPLAFRRDPATKLFYITAATLTTVTSKTFSKQEAGGTGLVSVLNLNGEVFRSREFEQSEPVISISSISVNPVAEEDQFFCAEYSKVRRHVENAEADTKSVVRSAAASEAEKKVLEGNKTLLKELEKELAKVVNKTPTSEHVAIEQKLRGVMLPVSGLDLK